MLAPGPSSKVKAMTPGLVHEEMTDPAAGLRAATEPERERAAATKARESFMLAVVMD